MLHFITVLAGKRWRASLSAIHDQMFSIGDRSGARAGRETIEYPVYRERSEHDIQHVVLRCFAGRWLLTCLEDRAQPMNVRCLKCTDLHSNYFPSELEMCVSYTQCLPKSSYQVQCPYAGIECNQPTRVLLETSRHVYGHQNTAQRAVTPLKKRHCVRIKLCRPVHKIRCLSICYIVKGSR